MFCDICGRELEAGARFCDACGRTLTIEEQPWRHTTPPDLLLPSASVIQQAIPRTIPAHEVTLATTDRSTGKIVESKPTDLQSPRPAPKQPRPVLYRAPRFSRRLMVSSAIGLSALAIIAVSLVAAPILSGGTLPAWLGATSSQTTVTSTAGRALSVKINIAKNPMSLGSAQTIIVTVLDQNGQPVPEAIVHLEITYPHTSPSGNPYVSEGSTDTNGAYALTWQIMTMPDNIGPFQVKASATKAGYEGGEAEVAFQVTEATAP